MKPPRNNLVLFPANDSRGAASRDRRWHGVVLVDGSTKTSYASPQWVPKTFEHPPFGAGDTDVQRKTATFADAQHLAGRLNRELQKAAREREEARQAEVAKGHWTGSKYKRGRDAAEVAKLIRADLATAVKTGHLPAGCKFSVRLSRYSMGHSITITIEAVPEKMVIPSLKRVRQDLGLSPDGRLDDRLSPAASKLLADVKQIGNAYNYDRSDSMSDSFDYDFALHVGFDSSLEDAQRAAIEKALRGSYAKHPGDPAPRSRR